MSPSKFKGEPLRKLKEGAPSLSKPVARRIPKKSDLEAIRAGSRPANVNVAEVKHAVALEERDLENQKRSLENDEVKLRLKERSINMEQRQIYATRTFWMVASWIIAVLCILLIEGFGTFTRFRLSDKVLVVAVGSTTFNVIGMLLIILRGLFRDPK